MNGSRAVQRLVVTAGDTQVASQVGLHLLGELADRVGLTASLSAALPVARGHDRGRLFTQTAMMLAGGGVCVADMAALRDQAELFGEVASGPTIWRAFQQYDEATLAAVRSARAEARARFWAATNAPSEVVLDIDAALVEVHATGKQGAASHFKGGYGFQPMFCFADHSGEALAGLLRPGNATANDAADQLAVIDAAVAQLPAPYRAGHGVGDHPAAVAHRLVVRADTAGAVAAVVNGLVARNIEFSVYGRVKDVLHQAIRAVPADAWMSAIDPEGEVRHAGEVAELEVRIDGWPEGTRAICRREEPHQGAQLRLWDDDGWRHQVVLTNSPGDARQLELRQRQHARVENSIKALRDTGLDRMPFASFAANSAWLEAILTGHDLLAWLRVGCLTGDLAHAEPKALRYRLLHTAARIVRRGRRIILRLPRYWPWGPDLGAAYWRAALLTS